MGFFSEDDAAAEPVAVDEPAAEPVAVDEHAERVVEVVEGPLTASLDAPTQEAYVDATGLKVHPASETAGVFNTTGAGSGHGYTDTPVDPADKQLPEPVAPADADGL